LPSAFDSPEVLVIHASGHFHGLPEAPFAPLKGVD
jgi:hypothetical protein